MARLCGPRLRPVNPLQPAKTRGIDGRMAAKDKEREDRLAAALRENLRKRKAQSRELGDAKEKANNQS